MIQPLNSRLILVIPTSKLIKETMSVYTHLTERDIASLLSHYNLGTLSHFSGIEGGVENTNYFIDVRKNTVETRYVLTLFEYLPAETLPFFIDVMTELAESEIPVPSPIRDKQGTSLHTLNNKPCLISPCFKGQHLTTLTEDACWQVGTQLARIHKAGLQSELRQDNQRGIHWLESQVQRLEPLVSPEDARLMQEQWKQITRELSESSNLPVGLIHGDLFHDNVLFEDGQVTGIIDFYNACQDILLYDLAVTVNDWCINPDYSLHLERLTAMTQAYHAVRPFSDDEKQAWPLMLRLAAFRFWISRLITFIHPEHDMDEERRKNQVLNFKDPHAFKSLLLLRSQDSAPLLC